MFIAFCTIYVGAKQYRDQSLGGVIAFTPALLVGLGISAIAAVIYVIMWEVYLYATDYEFFESYVNSIIEDRKMGGATEIELAEVASEMEQFMARYADPLYRLPVTLLEVFPVGLLVSLISAAVVRNHNSSRQAN